MRTRHVLYDLTDVLLLHLILCLPGFVLELFPAIAHWSFFIYIVGMAWAVTQLILGVKYRERLLHWWEHLPAPAVWTMTVVTVLLFASSLVEEILVHHWTP